MSDLFKAGFKTHLVQALFIVMTSLGAQAGTPIKSPQLSSPDQSPKTLNPAMVDKIREMQKDNSFTGGDSGGGGGMSLIWNGEVRLLDLVHDNDPFYSNAKFMTSSEREANVRKTFYSKNSLSSGSASMVIGFVYRHNGWTDTLGVRGDFPSLFRGRDGIPLDIYERIVRRSDRFPILSELVHQRCDSTTPVLMYQQPLNINESSRADSTYFSNRFPKSMQQPLVYYYEGVLIVAAQLFEALDDISKTALGVHECLRHLNSGILREPLTTAEIEALTRYIMNLSFDRDSMLLNSAQKKMENITDRPSRENTWVRYYKIAYKCDLIKKDRNPTWDEWLVCDDARSSMRELYYSRDIPESKERLFCIMENASIIPGWNKSKKNALSRMDIRDVYDYFKKAESTIGTCRDSVAY